MKDPRDVVARKRDGEVLSEDELRSVVLGYARGEIPDYLAAAFLMAAFIRGLGSEETEALTRAMVDSGITLPLKSISRPKVDKHSTGGVADGVTLVFAPLAASLGLAVAKLSGRGLGHTGGTLDKLESIPGFRTDLAPNDLERQVEEVGCAVAAQSNDLVPADGALYALREATATVPSVPFLASSVMSKKLAVGTDLILVDVKAGSGAFMKTPEDADALARACVDLAAGWGRRARAAVTDMSQPLGDAVGNALDVEEAVGLLRGEGGGRLRDLTIDFAAAAQVALLGAGRSEPCPPVMLPRRSGGWSRLRAGTPGSSTIRTASCPEPRCPCRSSPVAPVTWLPWMPKRSDGRRSLWEPGGSGRATRSIRPSASCSTRRWETGSRPAELSARSEPARKTTPR
jgi:pyrimidine-nucleoside phosphorylase